jgi:hypothetical protein
MSSSKAQAQTPTKELVRQESKKSKWKLPTNKEDIHGIFDEVVPVLGSKTKKVIRSITDSFWDKQVPDQDFRIKGLDPNGNTTLLVVPTENENKEAALEVPLANALRGYSNLGFGLEKIRVAVESGVGEQPYGIKAGFEGACNRAKNLLSDEDSISKINQKIKDLKDKEGKKVKNIIIGSVENFILPAGTKMGDNSYENDDIDFGACIYVDLLANKVRYGLSNGTPVPKGFVKFAQSFGFADVDVGNTYGLITVGNCMSYVLGISSGDWHKWVLKSGKSRFTILKECNTKMLERRPLPFMEPINSTRDRSNSRSSRDSARTAHRNSHSGSRSGSRGRKESTRSSSTHSHRLQR